jgi:mRNA-degrading endonuclease RelE of RelBE toxin-antitoxin system
MAEVAIIRAAFREIQKLTLDKLKKVYDTLLQLSREERTDTKHLQGYPSLRRTRTGDLRIIWQLQNDSNVILVIKVGQRDRIYDRLFELNEYNFDETRLLEELRSPNDVEASEHPTYKWESQDWKSWYQYVYGSYRYTPILTPYQRNLFNEPWQTLYNPHYSKTWLIQSSPGTGKTVCSTLFACELSEDNNTNVFLIIPEALQSELLAYPEVKKAQSQDNFWVGIFRDWLAKINLSSSEELATSEQELDALREATDRTRTPNSPKSEDINQTHVLLYQAFILDQENENRSRNAIYRYYQQQGILEKLKQIQPQSWTKALSGYLCRLDAARKLKSSDPPPVPNNAVRNILIVDEAQDYLLAELQALMSICDQWTEQGVDTHLWLLGDLNQRIQPTDFDWGQLELNTQQQLQINRNYRNSRRILEFANQFVEEAARQETRRLNSRDPIKVTNPEDAFEVGENVGLLVYNSITDANKFLRDLAQISEEQESKRYLLHDLANAVKVLSPHHDLNESEGLIMLDAERAKGREFEACVAFRLFEGEGQPSIEDSFQWYTLLTRARSRLLIVATEDEVNRLGKSYFEACEPIEPQQAIAWITEVASDIDLDQIPRDVKQRLFERCRRGKLYWDTYLALDLAGYRDDELNHWETEAINLLREHLTTLQAELDQTYDPRLRCLLLRGMQKSWEAVSEIAELQDSNLKEYQRIIEAIAQDLEQKNLPLEAARVRAKINPSDWEANNYPFPEIGNYSCSLIPALSHAFKTRIESQLNP